MNILYFECLGNLIINMDDIMQMRIIEHMSGQNDYHYLVYRTHDNTYFEIKLETKHKVEQVEKILKGYGKMYMIVQDEI